MEPSSSTETVLIARRLPDEYPGWRFTLREFLLAVTAVAALIALAVKSYPASPSSFKRQFNATEEFEQLCKEQGVELGSRSSGGGTTGGSGSTTRRWDLASHQDSKPLHSKPLRALQTAFAARVERSLSAHNCKPHARSKGGNRFHYSYRCGGRQGDFVAEFIELPDGHFRMYAFCVEFTCR